MNFLQSVFTVLLHPNATVFGAVATNRALYEEAAILFPGRWRNCQDLDGVVYNDLSLRFLGLEFLQSFELSDFWREMTEPKVTDRIPPADVEMVIEGRPCR